MAPSPYDPAYHQNLPNSAELHGPWADYFGRTIGELRTDLVVVYLPGQSKPLLIHERVLPAFNEVLANLAAEAAQGNVYEIRDDTWSYANKTVKPGRYLSFHGAGMAIDVNSLTNPYRGDNVLITDMPPWFVDAWRDAGWCWGGDWVSIKDPMHFSWMGPVNTPQNGPDLPPYPAHTAASSFTDPLSTPSELQVTIPVSARFAIDIDRDGAPDILRLQESYKTGSFRVEAAIGKHSFQTCVASEWEAAPAVSISHYAIGDYTADGRPEVWFLDDSGASVVAAIYSITERVGGDTTIANQPDLVATVATSMPSVAGAAYVVGDHDRDTEADLYVVTPGVTTRLEVWSGPSYDSKLIDVNLAVSTTSDWRFGLGDHDLDGIPDLYGVSPDSPATVAVVHGGSGFTGPVSSTLSGVTLADGDALSVEDYDGDGRDDLYLIGSDGDARVVLGGVRAAGADLDGWFVNVDFPWTVGDGCVEPSYLRVVTSPSVASQILVDGLPVDTWGLNWVKLPPGDYAVSFRDREGFTTPGDEVVTVNEGATTELTGDFVERGFLRVVTSPAVPSTISVDGIPRNDWGMWTDVEPGDYEVCFGPVPDFLPPACETATVVAGATTEVAGVFTESLGEPGESDFGYLRVVTNPAVASQILIDGVAADTWGLNWLKLPAGSYTVSFRDLEGFTTPADETVDVVVGETTEVIGNFIPRGWLRVMTSPAVVSTIFVDGIPRNDWGMWTDFEPGDYRVCFGDVEGFVTPACQVAALVAGSTLIITGTFS